MRPFGHLLRSPLLAAALLAVLMTTPALANTAAQALTAPYSSSALFRAPGVPNPDVWNNPIPASQPVHSDSAAMTRALAQSMGINADSTVVPNSTGKRWRSAYYVYVADAATPYKSACSRFVLNGRSWSWNQSFHNATVVNKVPVPTGALQYDGGADHSMAIYSPSANAYWEFYKGLDPAPAGTKDPQGRTCDYLYDGGGRIRTIGAPAGQPWWVGSPGYFRNNTAGGEDRLWGRQATALPTIGGLITPQEFDNPSDTVGYGHALSFVVPWAKCGVKLWPAARNDCGAAGTVPEGARLRFAPDANCSTPTGTGLFQRRVRAFCVTMKVYGGLVVDQTGNGFAWKQRNAPTVPDGGSNGGQHWPFEYYVASLWNTKLQVLGESPHPQEWAPGCLC